MKLLLVTLSFFLISCTSVSTANREVSNIKEIASHQRFITHPSDSNKRIEYFVDNKKSNTPQKTIILVHGHQHPQRPGGYDFVKWKVLEKWKNRGYVAVAISQPGYGNSDGSPDYCGIYTQDAIITVKNDLIKKGLSDPKNISLLGISRGAMVSGMVASRQRDIKNLVLIGGAYDLEALYNALPDNPLKRNIRNEAGTETYQFRERSVLSHAEKINARTLILHGKNDREPTFKNASDLFSLLKVSGNQVQFKAFESGHRIPIPERNKIIDRFLLN